MDGSRLRGPRARRQPRKKGGNITLYISDLDVDVWNRADEYVRQHGVSLSSLVVESLARYLADPPKPEER